MAESVGLSEAVDALKERFGPELHADRDEGRNMMAEALRDRFGLGDREARELVRALEDSHTIRWVELGQEQDLAYGAPDTGYGTGIRVEDAYWQL